MHVYQTTNGDGAHISVNRLRQLTLFQIIPGVPAFPITGESRDSRLPHQVDELSSCLLHVSFASCCHIQDCPSIVFYCQDLERHILATRLVMVHGLGLGEGYEVSFSPAPELYGW